VLSQLAHRVFGPLQPTRTRIVLDYHGLLDHPAGPPAQIAGRYRVTTRTVSNNVSAVRVAGTRPPPVRVANQARNLRVRAGRRSPRPGADPVPAGLLTVARAAARAIAAASPRGTCPHCAGTADERTHPPGRGT
jgi:hypothetical protein